LSTTPDPNEKPDGQNPEGDKTPKADTVAYETHKKLLDEKKKIQERLDSLEKKAKESQEAELKEKERFKELYESVTKELESERSRASELTNTINNSKKLSAFLGQIEGEIPKQYWNLIDTDAIDMAEGKIDEASVRKVAAQFKKEFPEVIKKKAGPNGTMPNEAAGGGTNSLDIEAWKNLPYDEKKKRMKDVKDFAI
jgi:alanyl-tRNA synthetase